MKGKDNLIDVVSNVSSAWNNIYLALDASLENLNLNLETLKADFEKLIGEKISDFKDYVGDIQIKLENAVKLQ